jgi:hypothetical protein
MTIKALLLRQLQSAAQMQKIKIKVKIKTKISSLESA